MKSFLFACALLLVPAAIHTPALAHETGKEHKHFFVNSKGEKQIDVSNGQVAPPSGQSQAYGSVTCRTYCTSYSCRTRCY